MRCNVTRFLPLAALLCVLQILLPANTPSFSFFTRTDLPGTGTVQVVSGDFNGDGIADIAALGQSDIRVYLGQGNRQFRLGSITPLPGTASSYIGMVVADFNRDGKSDLAVFGGAGFLLLGNGDGTFRRGVSLPSTSTPVVAADFNGDGNPDLAVGTPNGIGIFLGNGDGAFAGPVVIPGSSAACIAAGDLNGDGKPDIASCNLIYLGKGDGTFSRGIPFALPSQADFLTIGDLNLDGKADLVAIKQYINGVSESLGPVYVLFGNGNGTFQPAVQIQADSGTLLPTAAIGDVNGDGWPDIVVLGAGGLVGILTGNGHNGFNRDRVEPVTFLDNLPWGSVALADLTGDHHLDIMASGNLSHDFSVLFHAGGGGFANVRSQPIPNVASMGGADDVTPVAQADFNGDGLSDLAFVYTQNHAAYIGTMLQTGIPGKPYSPGPSTAISLAGFSGWNGIVAGDFNRDGKPDLAICFYSISGINTPGAVEVFLGNGDGTFTKGAGSVSLGVTAFQMIVGDFNGDGKPDLAFSSGAVALGNGDGTFGPPISFYPGDGNHFAVWLGAADFNGDGKLDLAFQVCQGCEIPAPLVIFLGNGDGTFVNGNSYTFDGLAAWAAIADVNGDGIPDIVDLNGAEGLNHPIAEVLLGNGDGSFKPLPVEAAATMKPNQVIAADLNGDGKLDLAVTDWDQNSVYLFAGNGDGAFGPPTEIGGGVGPGWLFGANLQGQRVPGFPDLVTVDFEPNGFAPPLAAATAVSILYNIGAK